MSDHVLQLAHLRDPRAQVIHVLAQIQQGASLSSLTPALFATIDESNRAFSHELLYGTLRQWWALSRIIESLATRPVEDPQVIAALHIGLYQLLYLDTPDYAAVNSTLEALKTLDGARATGFVNAILRKVQKSVAKYVKKVNQHHSLPNWLAKQLKQDWAEYYNALGQALRQPALIFLRVNHQRTDIANYSALLTKRNIAHEITPIGLANTQAIRLVDKIKIQDLPHFADSWVSVQDLHAQIAGYLLAACDFSHKQANGLNILDACAAPGGKTAHLLELSNSSKKFHVKHLTALDNEPSRLQRLQNNVARLNLTNIDVLQTVVADATAFKQRQYDAILLDAPCTATGVIRRHPDIALLRQPDDVTQTVALQAAILHNIWQQLSPDGYLLYVTCSLLQAENEQQIGSFLQHHHDAHVVPFDLKLPNQLAVSVGYQCLPLDPNGGDGFYYALLQKIAP